jgi:hypothetical protein
VCFTPPLGARHGREFRGGAAPAGEQASWRLRGGGTWAGQEGPLAGAVSSVSGGWGPKSSAIESWGPGGQAEGAGASSQPHARWRWAGRCPPGSQPGSRAWTTPVGARAAAGDGPALPQFQPIRGHCYFFSCRAGEATPVGDFTMAWDGENCLILNSTLRTTFCMGQRTHFGGRLVPFLQSSHSKGTSQGVNFRNFCPKKVGETIREVRLSG